MRFFSLLLVFATTTASAHTLSYNHDFPDPSVIRSHGFYYAYATQTITDGSQGKLLNIQVARSMDLKSWEHLGDALPIKPRWASRTQKFWAPHIHKSGAKFFMYYSADPDSQDGLCLAVATADKPEGPFVDSGKPLRCGPGFENIDPMLFVDPETKTPFLYWGSGFGPIRVQEMAPSLIEFAENSVPKDLLFPRNDKGTESYLALLEAAWMHKHGRYYYLFVSGSNCCEPNPHYAVMVARSETPLGPFEWRENDSKKSIVIEKSERYLAPGHNAVITDSTHKLWAIYHAIDPQQMFLQNQIPGDRKVRRILMRSQLYFKDGWPKVAQP